MSIKHGVCHAVVLCSYEQINHSMIDLVILWRELRGKAQIKTAHIINRNFPSEPFALGVWCGNLERCAISFRPQGLHLVYCNIDLLKGINALPRIPYDL